MCNTVLIRLFKRFFRPNTGDQKIGFRAILAKTHEIHRNCRILAEAANGPTTASGDEVLRQSDIFLLPDILCNAGGVTVSYFEWVQNLQSFSWTETEVYDRLYRILEKALQDSLQFGKRHHLWIRDAALAIGVRKVIEAKRARGLFP